MSAVLTAAPELRTFHSAAAKGSALDQAFEAELLSLGRQIRPYGEIEGGMRLRALAEIEAGLSTHELCRLAAEAQPH